MRPFVTACATIAVGSAMGLNSFTQAQDWLREAIPLENRTHDFGTVARAAKTEHRFLLTNNSGQEIHLRSVRASCGCTTPIIETETIRPGETGSILARFNTGTFTGSKAATLTVSIDKPFFTELQLNVRGYIRSDVVLNPGEINFGEVPLGEAKRVEVTLDYAGRSDWALTDIESPIPALKAAFQEISRAGGRVQYLIAASLEEDAPVGYLQNQILLHTNDRNLTTVPLRFMADVRSPIQISPDSFALGSVEPGAPLQQRLVVKAQKEFRILEITSDQADIDFTPTENAKTAHLLNIGITPRALDRDGQVAGTVELKTDLIDEPLRIGLTFQLAKPATAESVAKADP